MTTQQMCAPPRAGSSLSHSGEFIRAEFAALGAAGALKRLQAGFECTDWDRQRLAADETLLRRAAAVFAWPPSDDAERTRWDLAEVIADAAATVASGTDTPARGDPRELSAALGTLADQLSDWRTAGDDPALHEILISISRAAAAAVTSPGCITVEMGR